MEIYCKYCGALLEGEAHMFDEELFCDYDCLESNMVANTEIVDIKDLEEYDYIDYEYCEEEL